MSEYISKSIVTSGLVLYYDALNQKCYPQTGTTVKDLSGNNNTGTLTGGVGYSGGSFSFDGVDDYIVCSNNLNTTFSGANPTFTIAAWVKVDDVAPLQMVVANTSSDLTAEVQLYFGVYQGGLRLYARRIENVAYPAAQTNGSVLQSNTWHHVALAYTASSLTFYIDGVVIPHTVLVGQFGSILTSSRPLYIGARGYDTPTAFFNGNIPVLQAYNRALSAAEVKQNFEAQRSRFSI